MLKSNLIFNSWYSQRQRALFCISIRLMSTSFTKNLTSWFESKYFVNRCFLLMLNYIFLYWVWMRETCFYQLIYKPNCKFLSIFLLPETITWQYFPHKWLNNLCLSPFWLVCLPDIEHIRAQQTLSIMFFLFTKI